MLLHPGQYDLQDPSLILVQPVLSMLSPEIPQSNLSVGHAVGVHCEGAEVQYEPDMEFAALFCSHQFKQVQDVIPGPKKAFKGNSQTLLFVQSLGTSPPQLP